MADRLDPSRRPVLLRSQLHLRGIDHTHGEEFAGGQRRRIALLRRADSSSSDHFEYWRSGDADDEQRAEASLHQHARDRSGSSGRPIDPRSQRDLRKCGDEPIIGDPDADFDVTSVGNPYLLGEKVGADHARIDVDQEPRHDWHRAVGSRSRTSEATDGEERISERSTPLPDLGNALATHRSAPVMPMQRTSVGDQQRTVVLQPVSELNVLDPADPEIREPPHACVLLGRHRKRRTDQCSKHVTRLVLQICGFGERPLAPRLVVDASELLESSEVVIPDCRVQFTF